MIFKYKDTYIEIFNQNYNSNEAVKEFLNDKNNLKRLKEAFDKIEILFIKHPEGKKQKNPCPKHIKEITEDELIENVCNKTYRYGESKNNARFVFYENFINELRYIITGGSNILVVRKYSLTNPYYYSEHYDLDDLDD